MTDVVIFDQEWVVDEECEAGQELMAKLAVVAEIGGELAEAKRKVIRLLQGEAELIERGSASAPLTGCEQRRERAEKTERELREEWRVENENLGHFLASAKAQGKAKVRATV